MDSLFLLIIYKLMFAKKSFVGYIVVSAQSAIFNINYKQTNLWKEIIH